VQGLGCGKRRRKTNPNKGGDGDDERASAGNTSADGEDDEITGHA
jgi:hypothetical protein